MSSTMYRPELKRTLWNYTYRGNVFNDRDEYVATIRLILGIPLDKAETPANAPVVDPYITVLVEDALLEAKDIIDFETLLSPILLKSVTSEDFKPRQCFFFYASPAEALLSEA